MKCPNCGYENGGSSKFCLKCGAKLVKAQAAASSDELREVEQRDSVGMEDAVQLEDVENVVNEEFSKVEEESESVEPITDMYAVAANQASKKNMPIIAGVAVAVIVCISIAAAIGINNDKKGESVTTETESSVESETEEASETADGIQTQIESTTSEVTENDIDVYDYYERQSMTFDFSSGTVVFEPNEEFYSDEDYCTGYYTYTPKVTIANSPDVARNIENALVAALSFSDLTSREYGTKTTTHPAASLYDMSYQNYIIGLFEENGLLFVSINTVSDMGGGMSTSVNGKATTYIFDLSDGSKYKFDDFVNDKTAFLNAVDNYICDLIYDETYVNTDDNGDRGREYDYTLEDSVSYSDFVEEVEKNPWYNSEWTYDGQCICIDYHYLLGMSWIHKDTGFYIPKSVWSEYVDFSVPSSGQNADGALKDELGCKIMSGNTAANYANYTEYCFDSEYMYYAGGEDGYHWQLRKNYIGGSGSDGELLSDDMTDAVMVYGDRIYYRNATDGYKLYSISKNGTDKKMLTDSKASGIRIYDGKIYYTSDSKLYRMELDGGDRKKILDRACYDLQIYDDLLYITSADSSCVEIYDLSGVYQGSISSSITPTIKRFFVSYGNCVMSNDDSISIYNVNTYEGNGFTNVNVKGISEDKNNYIVILDEIDGYFAAIVPKSAPTTLDYYDYVPNVNDREFYIVYNNSGDYIYTFDKGGVVTSEAFGY